MESSPLTCLEIFGFLAARSTADVAKVKIHQSIRLPFFQQCELEASQNSRTIFPVKETKVRLKMSCYVILFDTYRLQLFPKLGTRALSSRLWAFLNTRCSRLHATTAHILLFYVLMPTLPPKSHSHRLEKRSWTVMFMLFHWCFLVIILVIQVFRPMLHSDCLDERTGAVRCSISKQC